LGGRIIEGDLLRGLPLLIGERIVALRRAFSSAWSLSGVLEVTNTSNSPFISSL
jgi:hypothetical protein